MYMCQRTENASFSVHKNGTARYCHKFEIMILNQMHDLCNFNFNWCTSTHKSYIC